MLRKTAVCLIILTGLLLMMLSTSRTCMQLISDRRNEQEAWWGVQKPIYGDLAHMAYLDDVDMFRSLRDYDFHRPADSVGKVDLYMQGDSYTWKVPDTAFAHLGQYKFGWRFRDDIIYKLDTDRRNILLIEIAERYVRSYFSNTDILQHVRAEQPLAAIPHSKYRRYAALSFPSMDWLFNPNINQNLEYNIFNYNFINPLRHLKAKMNYYCFNRASGDVVIADNKPQLFLKETVDGKRVENSYYPLQPGELQTIINNLNSIYDKYKADGFDNIYLSVIPNPVTIIQPAGYNGLIPALEGHASLKMKPLSIYKIYQATGGKVYRTGDTHWNNIGLQLWLAEVNKILAHEDLAATAAHP